MSPEMEAIVQRMVAARQEIDRLDVEADAAHQAAAQAHRAREAAHERYRELCEEFQAQIADEGKVPA